MNNEIYIPKSSNNLIMFYLNTLSYVRTYVVEKKSGLNNLIIEEFEKDNNNNEIDYNKNENEKKKVIKEKKIFKYQMKNLQKIQIEKK